MKPYYCVLLQTDCGSLFHLVRETIAKLLLPMAFLGPTEERVRLLVLIKYDKYVGWENLIALNVIRLNWNKIRYEMGSQCSICRYEVTWLV